MACGHFLLGIPLHTCIYFKYIELKSIYIKLKKKKVTVSFNTQLAEIIIGEILFFFFFALGV